MWTDGRKGSLTILGDELHGSPEANAFAAIERLCLHAAELRFTHPRSGAPVVVRSEGGFEDYLRE